MKKFMATPGKQLLISSAFTLLLGLVLLGEQEKMGVVAVLMLFLTLVLSGTAVAESSGKTPSPVINRLAVLVFLLAFLGGCTVMQIGAVGGNHEHARRISCASNLKQIGLALKQYASDNQHYFPPENGDRGLKRLYDGEYLGDSRCYRCPSTFTSGQEFKSTYEYRGGGKDDVADGDKPICWDRTENHPNYGNVLYADGHVTSFHGRDWRRQANLPE